MGSSRRSEYAGDKTSQSTVKASDFGLTSSQFQESFERIKNKNRDLENEVNNLQEELAQEKKRNVKRIEYCASQIKKFNKAINQNVASFGDRLIEKLSLDE